MNDNPQPRTLAIILAAGEGTRMKSAKPKVLHEIAGLPMLGHALRATQAAGLASTVVVVGPNHEKVAGFATKVAAGAIIHQQLERRGTAHAALQAADEIEKGFDSILVMFGDTPLIRPETIRRLTGAIAEGASVVALGFEARDPTGYGRLLMQGEELVAIREHKDASEEERRIRLCNGGMMALSGKQALAILRQIGNDNAQGEYYLPDAVEIARQMGLRTTAMLTDEEEILGVNDRVQLAGAERVLQRRLREQAMRAGVTMIDPETVFLAYDTAFGRDVVIEPNAFFGPGVSIGKGSHIKAFCHFEGATVGEDCALGPFLRLRPGARVADHAKIGNFVEIKNADIDEGAKISHLSYIGDAHVGAGANIGAGVITCNYDGFNKHHTEIGANAFVGSNSALVAPVAIGEGAFVGSGSVVTDNVPADALALGRGRQVTKEGWATEFRAQAEKLKAKRGKSG